MTSEKKQKEESKSPQKNEIEIENEDLLNVFFDNTGSQFESQFYLSRKKMLSAENGQNELSDLLKSKLKALDMMLLLLTNNKNILKESDLSCCETLNNLLSISKKDKTYGEQIYSKIKTLIIYFIKNKILLEEKNVDENKILIKFLLTLLNIKFDNGYFKQILDLISDQKDLFDIFIHELFNKLFKGRNITIKIKEMKYIIKSILINDKISKNLNYFDVMELILNYAKEKQNGGCRTSFQLNQVVYLLQYMVEIVTINEIKKNLTNKDENKKRLLKIVEIFFNSVNDLINKDDYDFDKTNINKKNLAIKNENIKRKKIFFGEMLNFLNKLKKHFDVFSDKEFSTKLEKINNLYKNTINTKYVIIIQDNTNNNSNNKKNKTEDKKNLINEEKIEMDNNEEKNDNDINDNEEEKEEEEKDENEDDNNNEINEQIKEEKENDEEEGIELDEETDNKKDEIKDKKIKKDKPKKEKKDKKDKKEKNKHDKEEKNMIEMKNKKTKRKESKNKDDNKKENKNKKKKNK